MDADPDQAYFRKVGFSVRCLFLNHRYVTIGATEEHDIFWRCKRCGHERYRPPQGIAETTEGAAIAEAWAKKRGF